MDDQSIYWPGWKTGEQIGKGGFGAVYRLRRNEEFGVQEEAALKHLVIPQDENEIRVLRMSGMDDESISTQFDGQVQDIVREYKMMMGLKNCPNIVHCDDFRVVKQGLGYNILLKMELLTPLTDELRRGGVKTEAEIIKLGSDICNALDVCQAESILHRDVKPQNIFLAEDGNFKLGDFGIARTIDKDGQATVGIGTYNYMAPEVFGRQSYDSRVDIYSLGLVLYWLLNGYRGPFLPQPPAAITSQLQEQARHKRFSGTPLPPPVNGSPALQSIVLKACAFHPGQRYATAADMKRDLDALAKGELTELPVLNSDLPCSDDSLTYRESGNQPQDDDERTVGVPPSVLRQWELNEATIVDPQNETTIADTSGRKRTRKTGWIKWVLAAIAAVLCCALALALFLFLRKPAKQDALVSAPPTETPAPTETTEPTVPETLGLPAPVFSLEPGDYSERLRLEISCEDPEAEVFYTIYGTFNQGIKTDRIQYSSPIVLWRGHDTVTAWACKGDLVSETVEGTYIIDYPKEEITFQEPLIEEMVRGELNKYGVPITNYDCDQISMLSYLDINLDWRERKRLKLCSLEDLQYLPYLTWLDLPQESDIADYSPLRYCPDLEHLGLPHYITLDLDMLQYVPNLESLSMFRNKVEDFSGLDHVQNLKSLGIWGMDIQLDQLLQEHPHLYNLTDLTIYAQQLTDYNLLTQMPNLEDLNIYGVTPADLDVIGQLTQLKNFELSINPDIEPYSTRIHDLSFLQNMMSLEDLELSNLVDDPAQLVYLYGLENLEVLYIRRCGAAEDQAAIEALRAALPDCNIFNN